VKRLQVAGSGSVHVVTADRSASEVLSAGCHLAPGPMSRAYLADFPHNGYSRPSFAGFMLVGRALRFNVDLSAVGCGCVASFSLSGMRRLLLRCSWRVRRHLRGGKHHGSEPLHLDNFHASQGSAGWTPLCHLAENLRPGQPLHRHEQAIPGRGHRLARWRVRLSDTVTGRKDRRNLSGIRRCDGTCHEAGFSGGTHTCLQL